MFATGLISGKGEHLQFQLIMSTICIIIGFIAGGCFGKKNRS